MQIFINDRRKAVQTAIKSPKYRDIITCSTPYMIVGGAEFEKHLYNVPDKEFILGVVKHLGSPVKEFYIHNKQVYEIYTEMVFTIVLDLYDKSKAGTLVKKEWFTEFAVKNDLMFEYEGSYMWNSFDYDHRCYLDLFTKYFFTWLKAVH